MLNQAVKRNADRFPEDFAYQLSAVEAEILRSQIVTSRLQGVDFILKNGNRSQVVTGSHGGRRYLPTAFTEHGALMAANVLRSKQAVQMGVFVIRAFALMREQVAANTAIIKRLAEIDKTLLQHDTALRDRYHKLLPLRNRSQRPRRRASVASVLSTPTKNGSTVIALKDYQDRVLESLRDFFKQCARDGRPEAAYQAVQLRHTAAPVPYLPLKAAGAIRRDALCAPTRPHRRRKNTIGMFLDCVGD